MKRTLHVHIYDYSTNLYFPTIVYPVTHIAYVGHTDNVMCGFEESNANSCPWTINHGSVQSAGSAGIASLPTDSSGNSQGTDCSKELLRGHIIVIHVATQLQSDGYLNKKW